MVLKRQNKTLRRRSTALEELIHHLKYMPDDIAQIILNRLRTTCDPAWVVQFIREDILGSRSPPPSASPELGFQLPVVPLPMATLPMALPIPGSSASPTDTFLSDMDHSSELESSEGDYLNGESEPQLPEYPVASASEARMHGFGSFVRQANVSAGTMFPQPYPGIGPLEQSCWSTFR